MATKEYIHLGKNVTRQGGVERVTGQGIYAIDLIIPNALKGGILRSRHAHARILGIDTAEAETVPGVYAVITARDAPDIRYGRQVNDKYILARDKVYFLGDPVAAVAADSQETVRLALSKIKVEYEPLAPLLDPEEAMLPDAPIIHEEVPIPANLPEDANFKNVCHYAAVHTGDADSAMAEAAVVIEETYETQMVHAQYLEPKVASAEYDEAQGKLTIWTSAQSPFPVRTEVARLLQIAVSKVRIIVPNMGGGFGGKSGGIVSGGSLEPIVGLLAIKARRPVTIVLDKAEESIATTVRAATKTWIQTGVTRDGRILARKARLIFDAGGYAGMSSLAGMMATNMLAGWYRLPNVHIDGYMVYTNKQTCGSVRGPGGLQATFSVESHTDTIASRLGMDPVEFRLKNMLKPGDRTPTGHLLRDVPLEETLVRAAEEIGWRKRPLKANQGIGFACTMWGEGAGPGGSALVKVNEDGSTTVMIGKVDYGTAIKSALPMIVAEELGIMLDDVSVLGVDTDNSPWDFGTVGSRTTMACGNAVRLAAVDARNQLFEVVARRLGVGADELEAKDKQIRVRASPDKMLPIAAAASMVHFIFGEVIGRGYYNPEADAAEEKEKGTSPGCATHAALVEVDVDTGRVDVLKYVAVHDVGFAIHPDGVEGQVEGGVVQGLGQALCEQFIFDENGRTINPTFVDYLMPTANISPEIQTVLVEGYMGTGPYGAKGIGEVTCLPPPAVVANAIHDAIGVRLSKLALTPERVLRALKDKEEAH